MALLLSLAGPVVVRWWRHGLFSDAVPGPLTQGAYVWQRQWTEAVRTAARQALDPTGRAENTGGDVSPLSGLSVFCAEIAPSSSSSPSPSSSGGSGSSGAATAASPAAAASAVILRTGDLDWPLLASLPSRSVGLVVRVRAFPGGEVSVTREPFPTLRRVIAELLGKATGAGFKPAEIQVDYDCPTTKLGDYAGWLGALRQAFPEQTFCPTALPAWLDSEDFPPWARAAGSYVLELHGLARPGPDRAPPETLCNPAAANEVVTRAARVGVPFRVALPTHGYRLILDAEGRLQTAVAADTVPAFERVRVPPGGSERLLPADPGDMAGLVTGWTERHPAALRGVLWHRLPVEGERLDWARPTFAAVRAGRTPRGRLQWTFPPPVEGSNRRELGLTNVGDADATLPPLLTVSCPEPPVATEATAPYELLPPAAGERRSPRDVRFRLRTVAAPSGPGPAPTTPSAGGETNLTAAATTPATSVPAPRRVLAPGATLLFGWVRLPPNADASGGLEELPGELDEAAAPLAPAP